MMRTTLIGMRTGRGTAMSHDRTSLASDAVKITSAGAGDVIVGVTTAGTVDEAMVWSAESALARRLASIFDGVSTWVALDSLPAPRGHGSVNDLTVCVPDVLLRQRADALSGRGGIPFEAPGQAPSDISLIIDSKAAMLYVSPSAGTVLFYDSDTLTGRSLWDLVHPDDADRVRAAFADSSATSGSRARTTFRFTDSGGNWRWLEADFANRLDDPDVAAIILIGRDINRRVLLEQGLRISEEGQPASRDSSDSSEEGVWAVDFADRTLYANSRVAAILGLELSAVYERDAADVLSPHDGILASQFRHPPESGAEPYEVAYQHPDGAPRLLRLSMSALRDEGGTTASLTMITDVTGARVADEALRVRALHDDLTGLANRTLLTDRLEHALARRERLGLGPVAVIFADLDEFKLINNSWGHTVGDALLVKVAERLSANARTEDTLAHFAGDKFVVVCENTDEAQARRVAADLLAAMSEPFKVGGRRVYLSASIGIALTPPDSAAELLRFANAAMYQAKAKGRGRVNVFDVAMGDQASDYLLMGNDLREALQRKQLTLDYQPLVDLRTGRLLGLEAFARWTHPRLGVIPPARFVAVAEATGLASLLGRWAIERATEELSRVRGALGTHVRVAVNISARHLADPDFEATVLDALAAHQVPRGALLLEITESAVAGDPDHLRSVLERLRTRGVECAVDGFGTGYSTLGHLNTLPFSALKIDHSFIDRMTRDSDSLAIVASVVDLARIMNLAIVAVGVETREQLTILRQLGCSSGQGSLWSTALPLEGLHRLVGALPGRRFDVTVEGQGNGQRSVAPEDEVTIAHGLRQMTRMRKEGASFNTIAASLNSDGYRTPRGLRWHHASIGRVLSEQAYPRLWGPDLT